MDKSAIIVLLCVLGCYAEELRLEIQGGEKQLVKAGETHNLICSLHMGAIVLVNYKITWQLGDTVLSSDQELERDTDTDQYGLSVEYDLTNQNHPTNITLILKNVQAAHEGGYTCKAVKRLDEKTVQKTVKVIVPRDVAGVSLTFDNETVSDENAVGVQREEGEFSVSCSTEGFNPSASLTLSLGDRVLSEAQDEKAGDADKEQFKLKVEMKRLKLSGSDTNQTLKCEAVASFDGAVTQVASLPLTIISLEPTIMCDMTQIHEGDVYADFKCTVDHKRVQVKQFKWVMSNSGEVIVPGQNDKKNTAGVKEIETGVSEVTLHLIDPKDRHFKEEYLIYVELENGQSFQQVTRLSSLGKATSGSSQMAASLFTFLLAIFLNL